MAHRKKKQKKNQIDHTKDSIQNDHANLEGIVEESQNDEENDSAKIKKRQYLEGDIESENEDEPKRKKKKKKSSIPENTTNSKNKKSNRQKKKEKFAQRQAELQAASKDQLKSQCMQYLSQWKHDRTNWKFMKAKQVWLYKNKFSENYVPKETWPLLMEYFESAKGNIRNMLLDDAKKIIKEMDDWTEAQNNEEKKENEEESEQSSESKKPDMKVYKRARDLIQCLEE